MEDPYDSDRRDTEGIPFNYDMTFYKGQYYSYFGVAPIVTLILPFRLITGRYTYCYIFNLFYMLGIMISLYVFYKKLIEKYVGKISLFNFYLGYYTILIGSNLLTLLRGMKYDIVVSCGIMFMLISLNLIIDINKNEKYKILKLILLGTTTGLIVLSKPNFIIYYLLIVFYGLLSLKEVDKKEKIRNILCFSIPLALLGIFQMIYNYIRFDNIFEFGIRYQLTGFNMNYCTGFTLGKAFTGVLEYIFKMPEINVLHFPFVFVNNNTEIFRINELLYENRLYGLCAIPILWIILFKKNILKNDKNLNLVLNLVIITSFIAMILNATFGGVCEVYAIDFKVILCIFAVILLLKITEDANYDNEITNKIMLVLCVLTMILMIPISFSTEKDFLTNFASDFTIYLKNLFEFWI